MHTQLIRQDLLELEGRLHDSLAKVLRFETYALYFPRDDSPAEPVWLPTEKRLLLPLRRRGELLGVFMARNAEAAIIEPLLPTLPAIADLCLDNLELFKAGRLDTSTGLVNRQVLTERLICEAESIRAPFGRAQQGEEAAEHDFRGKSRVASLGVLVIRLGGLSDVAREVHHGFAEELVRKLAEAFRTTVPEQGLAARTADDEFALLIPGGDRSSCRALAEEAVRRLTGVCLPDPFTGLQTRLAIHAGYALYPQDMDGMRARDMSEPAPVLLRKAGLAADAALSPLPGRSAVMAWGRLLHEGGVILTALPLSRVRTSLGRGVGAREGQRFAVWSTSYPVQSGEKPEERQPVYKAEIVLLEVHENESLAEILHLGDPAWIPEQGDSLTFLEEERALLRSEDAHVLGSRPDPLTGLMRHGDFLAALGRAREGKGRFTLALLHVELPPRELSELWQDRRNEQSMARVAQMCRRHFSEARLEGGDSVLAGRFALNSLIFFHPEAGQEDLLPMYSALSAEIAEEVGTAGVGLACWPFMDFRTGDMLEGSRKALEYALLLPAPHVGVFDSLALNISADKRHCRGDVFGAIEEYKLALLADSDNALAWNSLGVCMAGLGRFDEALRHFDEARKRTPQDPGLSYNMGVVCQNLGDEGAAEQYFQTCLELAPAHLHALIRLGQLSEKRGEPDVAMQRFTLASEADGKSPLPFRHLGRLAFRRGKPHEAREHLHQALLRDPRDALSLGLMAELYLEGGEDPELARSLARQSVALNPNRKSGWLVLARALEASGQTEQARDAWSRAGEL